MKIINNLLWFSYLAQPLHSFIENVLKYFSSSYLEDKDIMYSG